MIDMGFQEFKDDYLKATAPEERINILNSVRNLSDNSDLSFFSTQYKQESDGKVRAEIINFISRNFANDSSSILIDALTDNSIETRKMAVKALGRGQKFSSIKPLLEMLSNPSLEIRGEVFKSVVNIGRIGNLNEILECYEKENIHVKRSIPNILGKIQNEDSMNILKELLIPRKKWKIVDLILL